MRTKLQLNKHTGTSWNSTTWIITRGWRGSSIGLKKMSWVHYKRVKISKNSYLISTWIPREWNRKIVSERTQNWNVRTRDFYNCPWDIDRYYARSTTVIGSSNSNCSFSFVCGWIESTTTKNKLILLFPPSFWAIVRRHVKPHNSYAAPISKTNIFWSFFKNLSPLRHFLLLSFYIQHIVAHPLCCIINVNINI